MFLRNSDRNYRFESNGPGIAGILAGTDDVAS
jgi:hypothetical protein